MKKLYALLPLLGALLAPGTLSAQMMPDSTVQVVAYWEVGDQMEYIYTEHKYEIDADGNEKLASSSSSNILFEVAAATDSTYTLLVQYDNLFDSEQLGLPDFPDIPAIPFRIRTSEFGTFQELENLDEIAGSIEKAIPGIAKAAWEALEPEVRKNLSRKELEKIMLGFLNKDVILRCCIEELAPLFFYHGARLDTTEVYSFENTVQGALGEFSVTVPCAFRVDPELTDDYSAVLHMEMIGNDELVKKMMRDYLVSWATATADAKQQDTDAIEQIIDKALQSENMTSSYREYTDEEIHLETGWPIHWMFERIAYFSTEETSAGVHIVREISIAPDETEEE